MKTAYFEKWHRHYGEAIGPLSESEAQSRDASGMPYVVVIGDTDAPSCFIEVNRGFYGVSLLDDKKREYLLYNFESVSADRLFLKESIYREYEGATPRVKSGVAYRFEMDGRIVIESGSGSSAKAEVRETRGDVQSNWEDKPSFGFYEKLIRKERGSTA